MLTLNDLLRSENIDPGGVLVFRHRPFEPELNKVLPWLASDQPEVYNAYQQTQTLKVENAMKNASHVASFIRHSAGKALFIGLYTVGSTKPLTVDEFWSVPEYERLRKFGMKGFTGEEGRPFVLWFNLERILAFQNWSGKLVIGWPPPERSWWRWADRNVMPVEAIQEESILKQPIPPWNSLVLRWEELAVLPSRWSSALAEWRGIYFIFDCSDCKGYAGSACGPENILGRWKNYATSGHGGNAQLRKRDPKNFLFSILERVSPDLDQEAVITAEATWKERLHTRAPFGLNDN